MFLNTLRHNNFITSFAITDLKLHLVYSSSYLTDNKHKLYLLSKHRNFELKVKMSSKLNFSYFKYFNAKISTAKIIIAIVAGVLNARYNTRVGISNIRSCKYAIFYGYFLSFLFWTTMLISGIIIVMNLMNIYQKLVEVYGLIVGKCELVYTGLWIIFYVVCTILTFIPDSYETLRCLKFEESKLVQVDLDNWRTPQIVVHICGFIQLLLFLIDGYLQYKFPRVISN